jgi:hypothetical protein
MPNVRPASNRLESTCSNAPLAERYIKGKDMTTAAITVAGHEKAILYAKKSMKKLPIGPLTPKMNSKKNPTTVGGNTRGSVKTPSRKIFIGSFFILTIVHAASKPKKKVIRIDRLAVFIEIIIVDQSIMSAYPL